MSSTTTGKLLVELTEATDDALNRASTRSEHIRLMRIRELLAELEAITDANS